MYWFTADTHFGHANIIKYCNRPFKTVQEMDLILIRRWNERVKSTDTVYFLGDFCFKRSTEAPEGKVADYYQQQLHGNIIFIKGNHDSHNSLKTPIQGLLLETNNQRLYCVHRPEHANLNYPINLVGHVHEKWLIRTYQNTILFNVGVDQHKFMPISINEVLGRIQKLKHTTRLEEFRPFLG